MEILPLLDNVTLSGEFFDSRDGSQTYVGSVNAQNDKVHYDITDWVVSTGTPSTFNLTVGEGRK